MGALVFSTIVLLGIAYYDLRPKWRNQEWKLLAISCTLVLAGYVILALASFGVEVYSPIRPLMDLVERLSGKA